MSPSLSEVTKEQESASADIARYLGSYNAYADAVGIDRRLSGTNIGGVTEYDPASGMVRIYYNPDFLKSEYVKDCVIAHEVSHLFQKEHGILEALYPLVLEVHGERYHLGLDIIEGTAEFLAEKSTGKKMPDVYAREYRLAKAIDRVYPIRDLYRDIEERGWEVIDTPEIREILYEMYSRPEAKRTVH